MYSSQSRNPWHVGRFSHLLNTFIASCSHPRQCRSVYWQLSFDQGMKQIQGRAHSWVWPCAYTCLCAYDCSWWSLLYMCCLYTHNSTIVYLTKNQMVNTEKSYCEILQPTLSSCSGVQEAELLPASPSLECRQSLFCRGLYMCTTCLCGVVLFR